MGMEGLNDTPQEEQGAEKEVLDANQEKIKELTETVEFWIDYAKRNLDYMNEVYSVEKMDETTEQGRWVDKSLKLYSAMIPRFEEIKKYLAEGKLEFPWGGNIETQLADWEDRRKSR